MNNEQLNNFENPLNVVSSKDSDNMIIVFEY